MKRLMTGLAACLGLASCVTSPIDPDVRPYDVNDEGFERAYIANHFSYCDPETGRVIVVPPGFRTDYTSIPWPVSYIFPRKGRKYVNAAFVHDYLYALGLPGQRAFADRIMLYAMDEYDVDWLTRHIIYLGVSWGGADGYGRSEDWAFVNPDGSVRYDEPRPERPYKQVLDGCRGYVDRVRDGTLFDGPAAPADDPPSDPSAQDGPRQP
ncbi:MAG: DUF1353 domain-containing protein [Caulobacterales bacterium]|nr:DUF1353 domain-containing protein [Caulobacterales bacterium]